MTTDRTTRRLVELGRDASYEHLDAATVHECKRRVIDTFAAALGAYHEPDCIAARLIASRYLGVPDATIWGTAARTAPEIAAFVNGTMVRFLDVSDTYLGKGGGHPSDMTPALFAVAESTGAAGRDVINAIVLAYDVYCSLNDAVDIGAQGWDQTLYAVLGTVVGAGKLARLSAEELAHAIALALTPNMGLRQTRQGELSSWKGCAGPNAARNAVFAVQLAQAGFTGPSDVFEGKQGLWNVLGRFDWPLPDPHGPRRKVNETHIKSLPICYHGQSAAWCALQLQPEVRGEEIERIEVMSYRTSVAMMGNDSSRWAPTTRETADHSMPYVIAIALLDGKLTTQSFEGERWNDPAVRELMRKVAVSESAELTARYPQAAPSHVTVHLRSGKVLSREAAHPPGHAANPVSDGALEEKFRAFFREHGSDGQCDAVLRRLWTFEDVTDVRAEVLTPLALH